MKKISLLVIFFIAASVIFGGFGVLMMKNLSSYLGMLGNRVEIVVFLSDSVSEDARAAILGNIGGMSAVEKTKYTSKEEALNDFMRYNEFSDQVKILDRNPLPATVDVYLKVKSPEAVKNAAGEIRNMDGVEDVYFTSSEAENLVLIERIFKNIAAWCCLLFAVFFLASAAGVALAIPKLGIIYGAADGAAGAVLGSGCLYLLYRYVFVADFAGIVFFTGAGLGIILLMSLAAGIIVRIPKNVMEKN